jgi:hypothetical protein
LGSFSVGSITVELAGGTNGPANNPGVVIFDNLMTQLVQTRFAVPTIAANESSGIVTLTVQRSGLVNRVSSVEYFTVDGTAQQRSRYVVAAGVVNFAAGGQQPVSGRHADL